MRFHDGCKRVRVLITLCIVTALCVHVVVIWLGKNINQVTLFFRNELALVHFLLSTSFFVLSNLSFFMTRYFLVAKGYKYLLRLLHEYTHVY